MNEIVSKFQSSRRQFLKLMTGAVGGSIIGGTLVACSNAGPTYYTLSSVPGRVYLNAPSIIEVHIPTLAGFLDKDRIVSEISNNQLTLSVGDAWGESISMMMGRVMMLNLSQRLPNSRVFLQNQATATQAQAYVDLDVSRFNQDASGKAVATIDLVVYRQNQQNSGYHRLLSLEKVPPTNSVQGLVVALNQLLGEVSGVAAQSLATLPIMPNTQE